ncbi:MAG: DUF1624 domain-containing protein [Clostridia bacterium]|nr:DUF1624 domain-containing protein [Clostridia bacterium]
MKKTKRRGKSASAAKKRIHLLDLLRGLAVIGMVIYHLFYTFGDLFGFPLFIRLKNGTPKFVLVIIAVTFILVSAYSSSLSRGNVKRGARIFAVALGLSLATCYILPLVGVVGAEIKFGILHFFGIAIMLSPLLLKLTGKVNFYLGAALCIALAIGTRDLYNYGFFGIPVTDPIQSVNILFPFGIYHEPFYSADYYPLLPWIFVFMIGCFLAVKIPKDKMPSFAYKKLCPPVEFLGRHALLIYVVHQPVIFGIGELISLFLRRT